MILFYLLGAHLANATPLFTVKSSDDGIRKDISLCLNGKEILSCEKYAITGYDLWVKANSSFRPSFPNAGIKTFFPIDKYEGCIPYSNGYCIFYVSTSQFNRIIIHAPVSHNGKIHKVTC